MKETINKIILFVSVIQFYLFDIQKYDTDPQDIKWWKGK